MCKFIKLIFFALFGSILISSNSHAAEANSKSIYVAAFPVDAQTATPGSLSFTTEGDETYLTLVKGELHVRMLVKVRHVDNAFKTAKNKYFDAVYVAEDGLMTVVVTGRIVADELGGSEVPGDGKIAIHKGASADNGFSGSIALFPFTLAPLTAEQVGAEQPATRPESKPEGGDKPQPEAEGRSR